ncbi:hypothetical protein O5D80_004049 [Batrachochytrium dendrobatidis]|nr:hypothetical protein O5D80_004049 [Batrachochytrium dendrobatidis]
MATFDSHAAIDPWNRITDLIDSKCTAYSTPTAVALIGPTGIGKTTAVKNAALKANMHFTRLDMVTAMLEQPQDISGWILQKFRQALISSTGCVVTINDILAWIPAKSTRLEFIGSISMGIRLLRESPRKAIVFVEASSSEAIAQIHSSAFEFVHETIYLTEPKRQHESANTLFLQEIKRIGLRISLSVCTAILPDGCELLSHTQLNMLAQRAIDIALKRSHHQGDSHIPLAQQDIVRAFDLLGFSNLARRHNKSNLESIAWSDIGGYNDVKTCLNESVVWFYKNQESFQRLGIRPPKGVLLYGPPGTGKTLIARAVAKESGAEFMVLSLSDLVHGHIGDSEKALAEAFKNARKRAPCIMFLDEIDSIFQQKESGGDLNVKLVAQISVELDSMAWDTASVVFLAATNHPEILDATLMRSGRFDRLIYIGLPLLSDRLSILQKVTNGMLLDPTLDLEYVARECQGRTGADLKELVQRAWQFATQSEPLDDEWSDTTRLSQDHFTRAITEWSLSKKSKTAMT